MAGEPVDSRMAVDDRAGTLPFSNSHRYYRYLAGVTGNANVTLTIPAGVSFMNIESNTNALKVQISQNAEEAFDAASAGSFAAENNKPARPVQPGDVIRIQNDDGAADVLGFVLVLEGNSLPVAVAIILG